MCREQRGKQRERETAIQSACVTVLTGTSET